MKYKTDCHGENIYCKPIYGLKKLGLLKEFAKAEKSQSERTNVPFCLLPSENTLQWTTYRRFLIAIREQSNACLRYLALTTL